MPPQGRNVHLARLGSRRRPPGPCDRTTVHPLNLRRRQHMATRGFKGRRSQPGPERLPPGQQLTRDFPVLAAGPTPHTRLDDWTFTVEDEDGESIASWGWEAFRALGQTEVTVD